jgi:hypothetical protein
MLLSLIDGCGILCEFDLNLAAKQWPAIPVFHGTLGSLVAAEICEAEAGSDGFNGCSNQADRVTDEEVCL